MLLECISVYLIISIIATTFFSAFIQSRGKGDYVKVLFLLSIAIDLYLFGYLQELSSLTLEKKLFWNTFQYFGIPFVSALWLTACLMYTGHFKPYLKTKLLFIYSVPLLTFVLRFTNELHHLYFRTFQLQGTNGYSILVKTGGIGFDIQGIHSGIMVLATLILYSITFVKKRDLSGEKILYMIGASLLACLGLVFTDGLGIDYMALLLPITIIFVMTAIFRNDFLEIKMLARELVFENSKEGIILLNTELRILDFNETAKSILQGQTFILDKQPLDAVVERAHPLNVLLKSSVPAVWMAETQKGTFYYEITTTNLFRRNGMISGKVKIFRDITEMQLRTNYLKMQASFDELSGLMNRRAFTNSCQTSLNSGILSHDRYFLYMMDLDFFKKINDTYGHIGGDCIIEGFGDLLKQSFQGNDLSGRLGGEEFAVFLNAENQSAAYDRAEQFRKSVEAWHVMFQNHSLNVTVSIGIAEACQHDNIHDLLNKADKALYQSKETGRNRSSIYDKVSSFTENEG